MRLVGTTRRQTQHILLWELALIVVVAAALGTSAAWLTLTGFSRGMTGSSTPGIVPGTYALILAGATTLGLVATVVPAGFALRPTRPKRSTSGERRLACLIEQTEQGAPIADVGCGPGHELAGAVKEIHRVLRPSGLLLVAFHIAQKSGTWRSGGAAR